MNKVSLITFTMLVGLIIGSANASFDARLTNKSGSENMYCLVYASGYNGPIRVLYPKKTVARIGGAWLSSGYECYVNNEMVKARNWGTGGDINLTVNADKTVND